MPNASLWSIPEHLYPHVLQYLGVQDLVNLTSVGPLPTALIRAARGCSAPAPAARPVSNAATAVPL